MKLLRLKETNVVTIISLRMNIFIQPSASVSEPAASLASNQWKVTCYFWCVSSLWELYCEVSVLYLFEGGLQRSLRGFFVCVRWEEGGFCVFDQGVKRQSGGVNTDEAFTDLLCANNRRQLCAMHNWGSDYQIAFPPWQGRPDKLISSWILKSWSIKWLSLAIIQLLTYICTLLSIHPTTDKIHSHLSMSTFKSLL